MAAEPLYCAIYVDAPGRPALVELLSEVTGGRYEHWTIEAPGIDLHVDGNDEADAERSTAFPDGFLFFTHKVEADVDAGSAVAVVTRMLEALWARGWPAVAACEFEDELPCGGGYKSPDVPWPGR